MALQSLELGTAPDDGTGDSLRVGGDKINDNFVEIYTALGDGDALSSGISASASVISLVAPNLSGVVAGTQTSATITTLSATTGINSGSTITLDATTDIILDADGGDIFFKDAGTTFGSATNTSGNLIIKSGTTTAATFAGANVTLAGTLGVGAITTTGAFKGADGYTIGNASVAAVMTLASTGIVTFADDILIKNDGTIGSAGAAAAMKISSDGIVTFVDDIIIKDGGTIGSATDIDAIAIGSDGDVTLTQDLELQHDGAILSFGTNDEVSLTHVHDTGILLNSTNVIQFNDASQNIGAPSNAILDINATDEIELNATLVDINANVEISGTAAITGIATFTDDIVIGDGKTIGSASAATAITIASTGIVTLVDDLILKDAATIGVTSSTSAISIAATGIVTLVDDLLLKDACTIGTATTAGAIAIAADGTVDLDTAGATVASAVIKTVGKESIWVPAAAMYPSTTNPCADLEQVETTALRPDLKVLDFATGADEFAQFTVAFPKSWNEGTVTFQPFWTVTGTNTGTVAWQLGGIAVSSDDTINVAFGSLVATTALAHSGSSNDLMVSVESGAVTIGGSPAVGDCCFFQINRDISADNQSGDARLVGIKLFFTTDAANDA